jgi:hypothetical protein
MKQYIILLLTTCLYITNKATAQKITISFQNISLDSALKVIMKKTGMGYIIKTKCLPKAPTIKLKASNVPLDAVLKKMCEGNPFTCYRSDSIIFVAPRPVKGRVIDQLNEPIPNVKVQCGRTYVRTNSRGEFNLRNEDCDKLIQFSHPADTVIRGPGTIYLTVRMKNPIASINN